MDIVVVRAAGKTVTVDVKALAGKTGWPVDNFRGGKKGHFLALVCFKGKIAEMDTVPEIYIVPSEKVESLMYHAKKSGRKVMQLSRMRRDGAKYRKASAWKKLL